MIYALTLYLYFDNQWIVADSKEFPIQYYQQIEECITQELNWNYYYSYAAAEYIGPNVAHCHHISLY